MGRLRSTWLVELFEERLPITVIVAVAGVDTFHGLSRSLPSDRHERLLAMGAKRRFIDDADVDAALEEVDNSHLVPLLEEFVHLPETSSASRPEPTAAGTDGAILVEGRWYCPSMPEPLINATIDLYAERIDQETWVRLIAARRGYCLMPKQNTDADGCRRMVCPAEAGKAQCSLKPHTLGRGIHLPLIDPEPSPAGPVKVCRQRAITVSPEAGAKRWQALEYGGPEWQQIYFRLRNSVEGYNGYAKNPLAEAIEAAGSRRIRGIAAQTILPAFQPAHANRRKIKKWTPTGHLSSVA